MKKKILLQKLYIATVISLGLITVFLGLVYLTLVVFGPAPSMSYLISHSKFYDIFFVVILFILSIIGNFSRDNKRRAHFLLPTWMKEPINEYYAEASKNRSERRKDYLYFIVSIAIVYLMSILVMAYTLS